jgi:class 3 adenylate cyclase/tetratricopeptide (TPR) repeat protein
MRYVFGNYTLDTLCCELRRAEALVPLRPKVFHLLAYLLTHRDRLISRQELCTQLWPDQFVSDATLDACLAQARRAVGDSGRTQYVIQTRHGHGYRFVAAVAVYEHPAGEDDSISTPPLPHASTGADPAQVRVATPHPHLLMGERKVVTTLVCTLPNVATWAQHLETEVLHQRMQRFFALVLEEVERYGGTLQRVLDDSALVLFGAPLAHEDHAQRAVLAARALQQRLHASRPEPALPLAEVLTVCIGLHTGRILLGRLAADGRLTFTPVGDTLHLATWLSQQAAPGTILVSDATARLVQDVVCLEAWPPTPNPGLTTTTAYRVLGHSPRRARLATPAGRLLGPFVGRQLELATLQVLLTRVEAGQGQVVSLVGEPGMGKTRLVYEFWKSLGSTRVTYLEGQCDSYGQAIPYLPLQDIVRHACSISEAQSLSVITARLQQHLQVLGLDTAEVAPYLMHLLGVPDTTAGLTGLSPQAIRVQTFAALDQLLLRQSQRQPLLMVMENLHWIDPTSQEYLGELVERIVGQPLMLLATFRPGYRSPWMDKSYATQLTLPRLGPEDSQRVVHAVLPTVQLADHLLQDILGKAAGNPLFLEELAWAVKEPGGGQLPPEIPTTVQAILATRIDRLSPEAKYLLQTAAVIGLEVPRPLLQAVAGLPEAVLGDALSHLRAAEFLYETRLGPKGVYAFKHALTHEVAYGSLLQERRRALHACILATLESCYPAHLTDQVERLAHHACRGEVWDKALAYLHRAGLKAVQRSAYREAMAFCEEALRALQHLPDSRDTLAQAIDLRLDLRAAYITTREFGRLLAHLRAAETMAQTLGDERRLGRIYCYMANYFQQIGDHQRGIEFGQRALAMAMSREDVEIRVQTHYFLGQAYYALGDYRQAMTVVRRNVVSLRGDLLRASCGLTSLASVSSRVVLVKCLAEIGAFAEGILRGEEAVSIAEVSDHSHSCFLAYLRVGGLYLRQGNLPQAIRLLEAGLRRWQAYNLQSWFPTIASALGHAYLLAGQVAGAMPLLQQALARVTSMRSMFDLALAVGRLSEALLLVGCIPEAIALAGRALEHAQVHQERGHEAWSLRLLGEITARQEPLQIKPAEGYYRQALALAQALGMRPLQAHCHLGLGRLHAKTGQSEQARTELTTAINLYRAVDMTFWLPQAGTALVQIAAP